MTLPHIVIQVEQTPDGPAAEIPKRYIPLNSGDILPCIPFHRSLSSPDRVHIQISDQLKDEIRY